MMYLSNYADVKAIQRERVKRSLQRPAQAHVSPPESSRPSHPEAEADVVELHFATACDTHRIGA
jgi:hypothetical protein